MCVGGLCMNSVCVIVVSARLGVSRVVPVCLCPSLFV